MTIHEYIARASTATVRVEATVSRPPGRRQEWTAETGSWRACGPTEKAAVTSLGDAIGEFIAQYREPVVFTFRGHVAVLALAAGGDRLTWVEQVVSPDGRIAHSGQSAGSWEEVQTHSRYGLAQRTTDWFDDASVREGAAYVAASPRCPCGSCALGRTVDDFYAYAAWQRAARAAINAERDDWHEWATANSAAFAVPRLDAAA